MGFLPSRLHRRKEVSRITSMTIITGCNRTLFLPMIFKSKIAGQVVDRPLETSPSVTDGEQYSELRVEGSGMRFLEGETASPCTRGSVVVSTR
jgi:hypothetical protein